MRGDVLAVVAVLRLAAAGGTAPSIPPAPDLTASIQIQPSDDPMQMPGLKPFLSLRPADRFNSRWPDDLTPSGALTAVLTGKLDRFNGFWPFQRPAGDPSQVTKADYLAMILEYPGLRHYEELYGRGPVKPYTNVYEVLAICAAAYKATADNKLLDLMSRAIQGFSLEVDQELAQNPAQPPGPGLSAYWRWDYAYMYLVLRELEGTTAYGPMMETFAAALSRRANAWPIAPFQGAYNMAFDAAFWYDVAVTCGPKTPAPRS